MMSLQLRHALPRWSANEVIARIGQVFEARSPPARAAREAPPIDNPFPGRPRVLLVDDEPHNHRAAAALLLRWGIKPIHVGDGAEAVALACGLHFDLILMDLQMPVLDGLNAAAQIRRHERAHGQPSAPIVAYTSSAVADDATRLRVFGIDAALEKPCTAASLEGCLARWCTDGSRPMAAGRR